LSLSKICRAACELCENDGGDGDFAGAKMRIKPREGGKIDGKFYEKTIVFSGERWQNIVWKG